MQEPDSRQQKNRTVSQICNSAKKLTSTTRHTIPNAPKMRILKSIPLITILLFGSISAFQVRAPSITTKLPSLATLQSPLLIIPKISKLKYRNMDEDNDTTSVNIQYAGDSLLPLVVSPEAAQLKGELLEAITEFRAIKQRDGQGSEKRKRRSASQGPQKIDFYSVSQDLGNQAQKVVDLCNQIAAYNPTSEPTKFLGDKKVGNLAPLQGAWRSLFTTAADADFTPKGKERTPKVQNVVNAKKGTITNVVDFPSKEDGSDPVLKSLNVIIKATPTSSDRVELQFKYAKATLTKLLWFKFRWTLFIPVPPPFLVRALVFVSRLVKFGRKGTKRVPKGYFDILYLDRDLRVHKTGEDNYFVQSRELWDPAHALLQ